MIKFVIKRLLLTILVIVGAGFIIFTAMYFVPGDPAQVLAVGDKTAADVEAMRIQLGLDKPYIEQLGSFMYNTFLRFDLGISWAKGTSVWEGLAQRLPRTLGLGFITATMIAILGIPLGVVAATRHGKWQDKGLIVGSMVFISVPEFWLALMLVIVFSLKLGLLPSFGIGTWKHYILPVIAGGISGICSVARQTRASMLEVFRSDYVVTARAKGMRERAVVYKHMLPNALIPIITVCGNFFARCIGGTIVLEKIFSFPGLGLYLNDAINSRDYPIIRGCVVVMAAFTAIMFLIVDLAYGFADPQIKSQYASSSAKKGVRAVESAQHRHGSGGNHSRKRHAPNGTRRINESETGSRGRRDGGLQERRAQTVAKSEEKMTGGESDADSWNRDR